MIIRTMTATFGTLRGATMQLKPGMNIRTLPNESGKSTWIAFITAMLYGVPTAERASKNGVPAKTKYQPWSGEPMQGVMELTWQDRPLRIARASGPQGPMAEFQAVWQDSGEPVAGMNGSNCGQMLLGVDRAVFERSALIRQNTLEVTQSPELEQKLSALVTSGEAGSSYSRVSRTLKDWQNQRQYHKSGALPEAMARRDELAAQLAAVSAAGETAAAGSAELEELTAQRSELAGQIKLLSANGSAGMEQHIADALVESQRAEKAASALREQVLPPLNEIDQLLQNLATIERDAQALASQPHSSPSGGVRLAVFDGLSQEQMAEKAEADAQRYHRLHSKATREKLAPLWSVAAFLLAIVSLLVLHVAFSYLVSGLLILFGVVFLVLQHLSSRNGAGAQAEAILAAYGAEDEAGIYDAVQRYAAQQSRSADMGYQASRLELTRRVAAIRKAVAPLGRSDSIRGCRDTLQAARLRRIKLDRAEDEARQAKAVYERLAASAPNEGDGAALANLEAQMAQLDSRINQLRSSVSMEQGRTAGLGTAVQLQQQLEQTQQQIAVLQSELAALDLAQQAMDTAAAELQGRIFPQLTEPASRYIRRLTGGKYDQVVVDRSLNISARPAEGSVDRRLTLLSTGTADQLYLALRLAICQAVLPPQAPLLLDDALLNFDDERLGEAMLLLRELSTKRQILLFSCSGREVRWNQKHPASV